MVSGLIYALAFPPLGWRWLVVPAIAGFLISLHGQCATRSRAMGFFFGLAAFGTSLSWLWNIFDSTAIVLWALLALFPAAFAEFQSRASKWGISGWKFTVFTALNWGAWEFIRAEIFTLKFPWMTAGLAIGPNLLLPWIGVYSTGAVLVFAVASLNSRSWKLAGSTTALLLGALLFSGKHRIPTEEDPKAVKVAGIQLEGVSLNEYLAATQALPDDVSHVVWPENSVPFDIRENKQDWNLLLDLCRENDITLTFGTQARPGGGDQWRNIALTMDSTGFLGEHTKIHTVHLFDDGTPGKETKPVLTQHGIIGSPVCFDFDFTDVARMFSSQGIEYFVVPTMDAESWSARQHDQHAELARIRAAENGRWVFVTATSGVSQLIDPAGHLHARLGAMEQGTISGILRREGNLTFYTRYGWMLQWIMLFIASLAWLLLIVRSPKISD